MVSLDTNVAVDNRKPIAAFLKESRIAQYRALILITGQADECRSLAQLAIRQCKTGGVWIGSKDNIDEEMLGCEYLSAGKTTSALGQELQYAVIDGFSGFNPNDFACISGAVVAGGLVFLLMPPLAKWYEFNDPQFAHLVAPPQQLSDVHSRFLPWVRKVLQHSQAWWFEVSADDAKQSQELIASLELYATQYAQSAQPLCSQNDIQPNTQQAQCLDSIRSQLKRTKRPSVVVAPRGRGKSALLGWLAAQQIQAGRCVLITAPDIGGVSSIYKHASIALGIKEAEARSKLEFLLPYEATQHSPSDGTVLLVDEAAGIALPVLQQLYHTYGRCVFATTTQGYEGTGQGFNLRFLPFLRKEAQRLIEAELVEPVRWGQGDRLEQLCHKALLMEPLQIDNGLTEDNTDQSSANALDITCIDRDNLLEGMLAQVFNLLVAAHYRTTPGDLRIMLDSPDLDVWLATEGGHVVGVALIAMESGFDSELAKQIWLGKRRPRGQVMAQTLIANENYLQAAEFKGWRVMRIAVAPERQREKIGQRLLSGVKQAAEIACIDYMGAAFAGYLDTLSFWRALNYQPVSLGFKADPVAGSGSVMVIMGVTSAGKKMADCLSQRLAQQIISRLRDELEWVSLDLLALLLEKESVLMYCTLTDLEKMDVQAFAVGHKPLPLAKASLMKWILRKLVTGQLDQLDKHQKEAFKKQVFLSAPSSLRVDEVKALKKQIAPLL